MSDDRPPAERLENTLWLADLLTSRPPTSEEIAWDVRLVFDELDMRQLAIFRRLPGTRRLEMAFELCEIARSLIMASICNLYPDISDDDLNRRVRARVQLAYDR